MKRATLLLIPQELKKDHGRLLYIIICPQIA